MKKLITFLGIVCMLSQAISPSIYMVYAESFLEDESPQPVSELEETEDTTSLPEDTVASENISEKEDKDDSPSVSESEENADDSESKSDEEAGSAEKTSETDIKNVLENESILQSFSAPPTGGPGPGAGNSQGALRLRDSAGNASVLPTAQAWRSTWLNAINATHFIGDTWDGDSFQPFRHAMLISGASDEILNDRSRHMGFLVRLEKRELLFWPEYTAPLHYQIIEFPDDDIANASTGNSGARFTVRITDEVAPHGWIDLYGYVRVLWSNGNNNAIYMGATQGSGGVFLYNPQTRQIEFKRHERNSSTMSSNAGMFYTFSVRRPGVAQTIENINPIFSFTANGGDTVDTLRTKYNSASKPALAYGDVVEVFHTQPNRVGTLSSGNVQGFGSVADSRDGNRGYLELTNSGYRQLTFNRATPRQATISTNTTNAQLDASLANYLDMSRAAGSQIERFVTYPDRSRTGTSNGVIRVRQQLSTGNFVYKDYQVPFNVQDGIQADITHQNLLVGETFDINKSISNVRYRGTTLNSNQYTLDFQLGTVLDVAGTRDLSVKVTHNTSGESTDFSVPITLRWGNTIMFRGVNDRAGGALAYVPSEQRLTMTRGSYETLAPTHPLFSHEYFNLSLLRNSANRQNFTELPEYYKFSSPGTWNAEQNKQNFGSRTINYGDILKVHHEEAEERLRIFNNEAEGALSHRDNIAYLELTPTGYRQVLIDRVAPKSGTISRRMTDGQLDQQVASYLDLSNAPNVEVVGFTRYPDRSSLGQTTGTIQVQEKLSNGNYIQLTYDVPFTVHQGLEATPVAQSLTLGESLNLEKAVGEVKYNNAVLARDAYEFEYDTGQDLDVPGSRNTTVTVVHKASGERIQVQVPVVITWGETLLFRGQADRSAGALAYLPGENKLVARRGDYTWAAPIHPGFPDMYYSLEVLRNTDSKQALNELNTVTSYEATGNRDVNEHIRDIGTISIEHGDILKVYHAEAQGRLRIFNNEAEGALSHKDNIAYLELTATGYRQILIDRVTPRTGTISRQMTDEQLDQQAASYLNLSNAPNVEVVGFTSYPDRSSLGQTTGTIQVQEKLSNGKYVQMTYEVPFTVHQGLEATTIAQVLTLGETLDLEKAVNEVKYNNTVLARYAYELEYDPGQDLDVAGSRNTVVTVVHRATGERIQVNVPVTIRWGNTIMFRGIGDRSGGALAYVSSERRLAMTRGSYETLASTHPNFPNEYFSISLLRNSANRQNLTELPEYYKFSSPGTWNAEQNKQNFGSQTISYGDILKVYHAEARTRLRIFNNETEGALSHSNNIAYLELTPTGYRQVLIDRVTPRTGTISRRMTDEQLDQQVASYLNLNNAPNVEVVGFTKYPDRSRPGQTTGTIQVQEKLSNGNYVQMTYDVPFTVTAGLEATAVSQVLNLGETIDPSQVVKDVKYNGQALSNNDFEVKVSENGIMNLVGSRTINASITHKVSAETIEVEIPVTIHWGNTLILKGTARHESLGLSLIRAGNQLQLIGTKGSEDRNLQLHTGLFFDAAYLKIGLISGQQNIALDLPNYQRNFTYYGRDYKFDIIDDFGVNNVQVGDVVEVYHQESLSAGRMMSLYTDSVEVDVHENNGFVNQTTYYETTNDGLRLLFINQLSPKNTTISQTMSDEQLDAAVETYLEFGNAKNVEVVGFTRYPDRSRQGQTLGTIRVQEKLSNGNYIQMNYDVLFTVHQGLEATTMAQVLTLGETLDLEKAVNEVKYNNTVLARDAYEFEYDPRHDLDVPGRRYTMVTVVHKASGERIQVQVHLTIRWGETLLFRGEADRSAGALAYLPGENKIVARRGDNIGVAPIHPDFPELYYSLEVLRNTASQQSLDELSIKKNYEAAGSRGVNGHVSGIGTISIEYGDILKVYHAEARERLRIFNNEIEGALSHKDNIAYLELTPTGYRQVLIDRVTPRTGLISQNMTDEQLAQQAASYLNLSNAPNVEVVGFTRYPDRSSLGQTTGTIQVQEKLSNGKYVQMAYEVPFTVEGTRKITNVSNFDFGTIRKSNRRQIVTALNEEDTPLGLQLSDYIGTSNWSLQAYQSASFQNSNGDELRGVEIRLHNIVSQSDQAANLHTQNEVNLNTQPIEIANYVLNSSVGSHPVGNTTISFGTNHTPGVELQVPNSLEANEDTYRTTINWELVADPSQGVN
ncbi:putative mucin/carbohydrate-binding domain-containing protein [Enterococcus sp. C57]|uniref:putative mucin/carbohydrate-binding domain-containing protein n=1 Tax=Enterococcus sp. C57 TaxID=3231318 RepID=UPI0034A08066